MPGTGGRAAPLVAALRGRVAALAGDDGGARYGIAVSGGPDSMALLHLAIVAFPGRIACATMDHGLRAASADEAAMVAGWCADHAIPHATLHPAEPVSGNVQAWARAQRYAALADWRVASDLDWILTAHHADDQLETLLMRLNRGAGISGLAGVRARTGLVLRPLLDTRKADLVAYARAQRLPFVEDPSNADPRFDRASLRMALADVAWIDRSAAARSAAALAEAEEALGWMADRFGQDHIREKQGEWVLDRTDFPRELLRRLVLHMLAQAQAAVPRGDAVDHAMDRARSGGQASIGDWLLRGGARWSLRRAPPRR